METRTVLTLLVVAFGSLAAFAFLERRHAHPLLDLRLLRIREFTGGVVAQLLNAIAFGAVLLLLSLYFQLVLRQTPLTTGLLMIPLDISTLAAGPLSGPRLANDSIGVGSGEKVLVSCIIMATTSLCVMWASLPELVGAA